MFDEADLYLPAVRQPPTKEPMENLLRRARSAGLGLLLATQSPGDFDYKCRDNIRTWFVGQVKEANSLAKMKPMLSECRVDVAARLPGQSTGQFHLIRDGDVTAQGRPLRRRSPATCRGRDPGAGTAIWRAQPLNGPTRFSVGKLAQRRSPPPETLPSQGGQPGQLIVPRPPLRKSRLVVLPRTQTAGSGWWRGCKQCV